MTKNKIWQSNIFLSLGLFIFLYLAHTSGEIILVYTVHDSLNYGIEDWLPPMALSLITTVALLLFWLMQNKLHQRKWVEILYLIVGLLVAFGHNLANLKIFELLLSQYVFRSSTPMAILLQNILWSNIYLHIAGILTGVIGLLLLLLPRNKVGQ